MTFGIVVELPITGTFGTDEEFDLRTRLERDLNTALIAERSGECGRGETDGGLIRVYLEAVTDPNATLCVVMDVLTHHKLLHLATVVLETRSEADPDDVDRRTLWPREAIPVKVA